MLAVGVCLGFASSPARATDYETANRMFANGQYEESRKTLEALGADRTPEAQYLLGLEYIQGLGGRKKVKEGIAAIKAAADGGFPLAQFYLADAFFNQKWDYIEESEAKRYLKAAADSGNREARLLLDQQKPIEQTEDAGEPQAAVEASGTRGIDDELVECIGTGKCEPAAKANEAEASQPSRDETSATTLSESEEGNGLLGMLLLGGSAIAAFLFCLFFVGTRCPRCRKIRTSEVVHQEQTGQFVTTRMQTVRNTTTHKNAKYQRTGTSEEVRKVPVTITVREIDEHRRCKACGHEFINSVRREAS